MSHFSASSCSLFAAISYAINHVDLEWPRKLIDEPLWFNSHITGIEIQYVSRRAIFETFDYIITCESHLDTLPEFQETKNGANTDVNVQ